MDPAERSGRVDREGRRLIEVAAGSLTATVPSCPDWTAGDLLGHVATVWSAIEAMVSSASPEPLGWSSLPAVPDDPAARIDHARDALDRLVGALAEADPAQPVWTWSADRTMAFYLRRAHNETLVHRVDAEQAAGTPTPIAPDDGTDVVDELFSVVIAGRADDLPSGSLHLHQTDGDGEFLLTTAGATIRLTREHAKGDAALRASGEDLALCVWRRRPLDGLELFGDRAVAEQWMALAP